MPNLPTMPALPHFRFWCQKVLPLVYDNSLSYYEVLCKVVEFLNRVIEQSNNHSEAILELKREVDQIQEWINNFDTSYAEKVLAEYIATMVFFGITQSGYFVAYIPESWNQIDFATTGLDIEVPLQPEFGHLVLLY